MSANDNWALALAVEEREAVRQGLLTEQNFRAMMSCNAEAVARWVRTSGEVGMEVFNIPPLISADGMNNSDPVPDAERLPETSEYPILPYDDSDDDGGCLPGDTASPRQELSTSAQRLEENRQREEE